MKIRLDIELSRGHSVPVVATAEGTATVGDLAGALLAGTTAIPSDPTRPMTLQILTADHHEVATLSTHSLLSETRLCSGQTVRVTPCDPPVIESGRSSPVGWIRVISGSMAGQSFDLQVGSHVIGRDCDCDIVLNDNLVSRHHARMTVSEDGAIDITDLNSSNGMLIGDTLIDHATLGEHDVVLLGETGFVVERTDAFMSELALPSRDFNRSPTVRVVYEGREFQVPQPPSASKPGKFPLIAMVAPLLMGVIMFLVTRNPLSIVFVALSPLIAVGTWLDRLFTDKKTSSELSTEFAQALVSMRQELSEALHEESIVRCEETPTLDALVEAAYGLTPDLWNRRPEDENFLQLSVGYGDAESRNSVALPHRGQATADTWTSVTGLQKDFAYVHGVPITVSLRECGDIGLSGPRDWLDPVARNLIAQIVVLHSPAELVLCAIASASSSPRWNWLMWLPHVGSIHSPLAGTHLADSPGAVSLLVSQIEELVATRHASNHSNRIPQPSIVLLVENDAPVERGRLVALAKAGPVVGVHLVWLADRQDDLPAPCRAFVNFDAKSNTVDAGFVDDRRLVRMTRTDSLGLAIAENLARHLSPITDAGAPTVDQSDLPRTVSYLSLTGLNLATDPDAVIDRWREDGSLPHEASKRSNTTLRALIGQGAQGDFVLDLRTQGPHALVGGTTGSGKSEFLQSWILGLASAHSPSRVTFLFVDYKGGAAFSDCIHLPHTVGLVTDLSPHLVRRALTSLRAELQYRERLLNAKNAKDLVSLERTGDSECPPSLIIVVDEFAALVKEVPEFVDGVVDVAQRGRSLGLHLILATQRPSGVIKDSLRANTNLRVALRMADEQDSTDVIGMRRASEFDPNAPGRGAVRTGPGRIALFQTGYAGGRTTSGPEPAHVDIETLTFGPGQRWEIPVASHLTEVSDNEGPTDIARITATIRQAAAAQSIPEPRKPWLPDLASCYDLAALTNDLMAQPVIEGQGQRFVLGMMDDPARQAQYLHIYDPDRDGTLAVFGSSGSGKSGVLRTLAVGAALQSSRARTEVYGLDFGTSGLAILAPLPIVGDIIDGYDHERVARLLKRLVDTAEERSARYADAKASSITEYRRITGNQSEPRIFVLIDGFGTFREAYESQAGHVQCLGYVARLLSEGRSLGIHLILSADRAGAIPTAMVASIQRRLVLRQADENSYLGLNVAKDVLSVGSPPGRCVFAGEQNEIQVAVPSGSANMADQSAAIDLLAQQLAQQGITPAEHVQRLTDRIPINDLPCYIEGQPTLGIEDSSLAPLSFTPQGAFIVAGMPGSGRTTTLRGLAQSLRRWNPEIPMFYFGPRRSVVRHESAWSATAIDADAMKALAADITPVLEESSENTPGAVIMIEALNDLIGSSADQALVDILKLARRNGHFVIGETETAGWGSSWPLISEIRNSRRGIVLQPDISDGDNLFRVSFPRLKRADFPLGRGIFVDSGRFWTVQLPIPETTAP